MLLKVEDHTIGTPSTLSKPVKRKLQKKKVLIVLDDVNTHHQMETLANQLYGPGTKMLITSRDRQVLRKGCNETYEVKRLSYRHASQLFKQRAFLDTRCTKRHMDLSKRVVRYADGIPKVLDVLASKLHNKGAKQWESMLSKLANFPDKETTELLKESYDQLEDHEKSIFLDIVCFFVGEDLDYAKRFIYACGFVANSVIKDLEDKSLIKIWRQRLVMHKLVREMGLDIIRQQSVQDPGQRSRLWDPKDICHVIQKQRASKKIEGIALDLSRIQDVQSSSNLFSGMHNLRLLHFYSSCPGKQKVFFPDGLEFLPDALRSLVWYRYPFKSLPSTFNPENLVELCMPQSQIELFSEAEQYVINLKFVNLSNSKELRRLPDLSKVPDLQVLILNGCIKLTDIPLSINLRKLEYLSLHGCISLKELPSSIELLRSLSYLNLQDCKNLCTFPSFVKLTNLKFLSLCRCLKLTKFPHLPLNLNVLKLSWTEISEVPSSIGKLSELHSLDLSYCSKLESLPDTISNLEHLQLLDIEGCSKLEHLKDCFRELRSLQHLIVTCRDSDRLPELLVNIETLKHLLVADCSVAKMPCSPSHMSRLESLSFLRCKSLVLTHLGGFNCLKVLRVKFCGISEVPEDLGSLLSLEELHLKEENLTSIPSSIIQLSKLSTLCVSGCKKLENLPELPMAIQVLDMCDCLSLKSAPSSVAEFCAKYGIGHGYFMFGNCFSLSRDEIGKILDGIHLRTRSLIAWLFTEDYEELVHDQQQNSRTRHSKIEIVLCFPEDKLPKWFDFGTVGSSLTVTPSKNSVLDIRQLAFCAIVNCNGHYDYHEFNIKCECHLITKFGHRFNLDSYYRPPRILADEGTSRQDGPDLLRSQHLFLWYQPDVFDAAEYQVVEGRFEFYLVDTDGEHLKSCEVLSCGVVEMGRSCRIGIYDHIDDDNDDGDHDAE